MCGCDTGGEVNWYRCLLGSMFGCGLPVGSVRRDGSLYLGGFGCLKTCKGGPLRHVTKLIQIVDNNKYC